jgi:hypothetical protein
MLRLTETAVAAAANPDIGPAGRFAAGRLLELLSPGVHFSQSAAFVFDPTQAVAELKTTGQTFVATEEMRYPAMEAAMFAARDVLGALQRNPRVWFPDETKAVLDAIETALTSVKGLEREAARSVLVGEVDKHIIPAAAALLKAMTAKKDSYEERLCDQVCTTLAGPGPKGLREWGAFDSDLASLAAHVLLRGYDGQEFADAVQEAFAAATAPQECADALSALITAPKQDFGVALVLHGARHITLGAQSHCEELRNPAGWNSAHPSRDDELRSFLAPLRDGKQACGLLVSISATDPADAFRRAFVIARRLRDQLLAEHRTSHMDLHPEALVLRHSDGQVFRRPEPPGGVTQARPLAEHLDGALAKPLRYHGLARSADSPVNAIMNNWIALECLARGAHFVFKGTVEHRAIPPGAFLPPRVAAVMTLTALKNQWTGAWHLAAASGRKSSRAADWAQIETWFGVSDPERVPLRKWGAVLAALPGTNKPASLRTSTPVEEVAAAIRDIFDEVSPFVSIRLQQTGRRLANADTMGTWMDLVEMQSAAHVHRTLLTRHRVVHEAIVNAPGSRELAKNSHDMVDAVFETLQHWLPGPGDPPAWLVLSNIQKRPTALKAYWRNRSPHETDPQSIVRRPPPRNGS